jgi:hypothetical protein
VGDGKSERERRLAAALRANLARRKQEARRPAIAEVSEGEANEVRPDAGGAESPEDKR